MTSQNLDVEVRALRLIVERILSMAPGAVLDRFMESEREHIAHVEGGGETIPPSTPADLEASRVALGYFEEAAVRRAQFGLDTPDAAEPE